MKKNDAVTTIANLYNITPRYVRMIVADSNGKVFTSKQHKDIRNSYAKYLQGKEALIRRISTKIVPLKQTA